jgi:hypothetical protein
MALHDDVSGLDAMPMDRRQSFDIWSAGSEAAVIELLRGYLAQWTPAELAQLPEDCRPVNVPDSEAVSQWAVHLTRCELKYAGSPESAALLRDLTSAFVQAARRLAFLVDEAPKPKA